MFDVELLFLLPWAVSAYPKGRVFPEEMSGPIFGVMVVFMATLAIAYIYAWRKGVFKWR
jgi:NADH:ubiquinone oxidoreductase subunit 3 (subunit A)